MPVIDGRPDYLVFLDNVNIDMYVKGWNTQISVFGEMGHAGIEFLEFEELRKVIDDGTSVTIFVRNMFNGKYDMVFDGEIKAEADSSSPQGGSLSVNAVQQIYWLQKTQVPTFISLGLLLNQLNRLVWAAQGLDYTNARHVTTVKDMQLNGMTLNQVITKLFENIERMNLVYSNPDSVVAFANLKKRLRVMGDISEDLRSSGFADYVVNMSGQQKETMYVLLNDIVQKLNFEFYQDRDGVIRIKPPFWKDDILKSHVIDPIMVLGFQSSTDWNARVSRVIAIGGNDQGAQVNENDPTVVVNTPMGILIGGKWLTGDEIFGNTSSSTDPNLKQKSDPYALYGGAGAQRAHIPAGQPLTSQASAQWLLKYETTSNYGWRTHPVYKDRRFHNGIDFAVPNRSQLYCVADRGVVDSVGLNGDYGLVIQIRLESGAKIFYAHCNEAFVTKGQSLMMGQLIGLSGGEKGDPNAGSSTGAHLHFSYFPNGDSESADPLPWLKNVSVNGSSNKSISAPVASGAVDPEKTASWHEFIVTYYGPTGNPTASGRMPTVGKSGHTVAVDRRVIPLGTTMRIQFPDGSPALKYGFGDNTFQADDTGSTNPEIIQDSNNPGYNYYRYIVGRRLDIFVDMQESRMGAAGFGREKVKVQILSVPNGKEVNLAGAEMPGVSLSDDAAPIQSPQSVTVTINPQEAKLMQLTEEEKKYGISVAQLNQPLIKFKNNDMATAYKILGSYASYMYNVMNARVKTAVLNLIAMPWIRPGFNIWYDPAGKDEVYYVTSVSHNGSPDSGVYSSLGLTYGRSSKEFKDKVGDVAFLSQSYSTAKDFGQIVTDSEHDAVKEGITNFLTGDNDEQLSARSNQHLRGLYDTLPTRDEIDRGDGTVTYNEDEDTKEQDGRGAPTVGGYVNKFSTSLTYDEVVAELNSRIESANDVIKARAKKIRDAVDNLSEEASKFWISQFFLKDGE